jgi:glucose-1-phosphate thymidylyltransferase
MEIAKAVILAGRTAHDRPWPSVKAGPKHLVPIANRPIIFHSLESLRRAGVLEAAIAVDRESAGPTKAAVGDGSRWGLSVRYVPWLPRTGLRSALAASRDFIADEPVLVEPADALPREQIHPHIAAFARERLDAMALRLAGGSCETRGTQLDGAYLFSHKAVAILLDATRAAADPMAGVRAQGGQVRVQRIDGCLPCHGGQDRLLEGNRRLLETLQRTIELDQYPSCEFQGPVFVHPTATLEHTLVRGPAMIGPRARLTHAYVGPYTSIGADVRIDGCQVEHSIVLERAELLHVGVRLDSSVIGRGARIDRSFALTSAMRLSIGDGAEVTLS